MIPIGLRTHPEYTNRSRDFPSDSDSIVVRRSSKRRRPQSIGRHRLIGGFRGRRPFRLRLPRIFHPLFSSLDKLFKRSAFAAQNAVGFRWIPRWLLGDCLFRSVRLEPDCLLVFGPWKPGKMYLSLCVSIFRASDLETVKILGI